LSAHRTMDDFLSSWEELVNPYDSWLDFFATGIKGSNVAVHRGSAVISLPLCRLRTRSTGTCSFASLKMSSHSVSNQGIALVRKKWQKRPDKEQIPYRRRRIA